MLTSNDDDGDDDGEQTRRAGRDALPHASPSTAVKLSLRVAAGAD